MRIPLLIFFTFISVNLFSQIGIRVNYNQNSFPKWDQFFTSATNSDTKIHKKSVALALDYWIKFSNNRIELFPYLSYHQASTTLTTNDFDLALRQIGAGITSHVYLLDMAGDCDCPTFSKQGGLFKKGFFVMLGTGLDYSEKAVNDIYGDGNLDFQIHGGIGLDIGINDLITISPLLQFQYYPDLSWHELANQFGQDINNVSTSLSQLKGGVRIGFRFDYK